MLSSFFALCVVSLCTSRVILASPTASAAEIENVNASTAAPVVKSFPVDPSISLYDEIEKFLNDQPTDPVKDDFVHPLSDADKVHFDQDDSSARERAQVPDRCPCSNPMFDFVPGVRPNIGGSGSGGLAGPILWQISSAAENFIANMIGSITNGLLSGLGFNGYLNGNGRGHSRPSQDSIFDNLVGRGAFGQGHGSFTASPSDTISQLKKIIRTFIHSNYGSRLISVMHNLITNNVQDQQFD